MGCLGRILLATALSSIAEAVGVDDGINLVLFMFVLVGDPDTPSWVSDLKERIIK